MATSTPSGLQTALAANASTSKRKAGWLAKIPAGVLLIICDSLSNSSLLRFRRSCRSVCHGVDEAFGIRFFKVRSHIFTTHGLQNLVNIIADRNLAQRPLHIQSVTRSMHPDSYPQSRSALLDDRRIAKQWTSARQRFDADTRTLEGSNGAIVLFSTISANLASAGRTVSISVNKHCERRSPSEYSYGLGALLRQLDACLTRENFTGGDATKVTMPLL